MKILLGAMLSIFLLTTNSYALFPGRIAVSADGNNHDCDDIFSTAVTIAIIAKTGNAKKLVYYGYADHHWDSSGGCNGGNREYEMKLSSEETAKKYGGFDLTKFYNAKSQRDLAIQKLKDQINLSSSSNPLWIICAGPMDIVGRALAKSAFSRRKYVTLISHSTWNERHSDNPEPDEKPKHSGWTWYEIKKMSYPPKFVDLPDQNKSLLSSHSTYYAWRDSKDEKLRWLWNRNVVAGKPWPDMSDAGMVYWLIVENRGSDKTMTPTEIKQLLSPYVINPVFFMLN